MTDSKLSQSLSENKQIMIELKKLEQDLKLGFWGKFATVFSDTVSDATHFIMGGGK